MAEFVLAGHENILAFVRSNCVVKGLLVREDPCADAHIQKWGHLKQLYCCHVHLFVIDWGCSAEIGQCESICHVNYDEAKQSYREQDRQA